MASSHCSSEPCDWAPRGEKLQRHLVIDAEGVDPLRVEPVGFANRCGELALDHQRLDVDVTT